MPAHTKTYGQRAENAKNPTAKQLLLTMERKKTNLAVSVDVTICRDLLNIIEAVGPYVCLIKAKSFFLSITSSCTFRI
jgi:orotidine-5'-phosphate decarboxylase